MWKLLIIVVITTIFTGLSFGGPPEKPAQDDKDNPCWNVTCPQCKKCVKAYECDKDQAKHYAKVCGKTHCVDNPGCGPIDPCSTKKCDPEYDCKLNALAQPLCARNYSHQPRCFYPMAEGDDCKGPFRRFHYDMKTNTCSQFGYKGCGGNNNRFVTLTKCRRACQK